MTEVDEKKALQSLRQLYLSLSLIISRLDDEGKFSDNERVLLSNCADDFWRAFKTEGAVFDGEWGVPPYDGVLFGPHDKAKIAALK
jgi:hypothetical protein